MNKQFFTSCYQYMKSNKNSVRISRSAPSDFYGASFPELYPTWDIILTTKRGEMSYGEYKENYLRLLDERGIDAETIYNRLPDQSILLCYETNPEFCHRRIVAEILFNKLNLYVPEITNDVVINNNLSIIDYSD